MNNLSEENEDPTFCEQAAPESAEDNEGQEPTPRRRRVKKNVQLDPNATPAPPLSDPVETELLVQPDAKAGSRTVEVGSEGHDVKILQKKLYPHAGKADGKFGPLTEKALKAYQAARKILVDGIAGPVTWNHLLGRSVVGNNSPRR